MPEFPLPEAVLFDMDGLLVETEEIWYEATTGVVTDLSSPWSREHQAALLGGEILRSAEYIVTVTGTEVAAGAVVELLLERGEHLLRTRPVHWMPGARQLLLAVRSAGIPCALVSAAYRQLMDAVLVPVMADLPGGVAFDATVAGDDLPRTKPNPDPYLRAAQLLGADPQRCVVLEDSAFGAEAGLAAGCVVVGIPHGPIPPAPRLVLRGSLGDLTVPDLAVILAQAPAPERSDAGRLAEE